MPNPNGNPGNKGGGRKSAYEEHRVAQLLAKALIEGVDVDQLKAACTKKKGKRIKILDLHIRDLLNSPSLRATLVNKFIPDKIDMNQKSDNRTVIQVLNPEKDADNKV